MATCLVVATTTSLRLLVAARLEAEGHRVVATPTAEAGAAALEASRPDIVVLELEVAAGDHLEAVMRILRRHPRVPVLTMSAYALPGGALAALDVDDHLASVFDAEECRAKVADLLRRPIGRGIRDLTVRLRRTPRD